LARIMQMETCFHENKEMDFLDKINRKNCQDSALFRTSQQAASIVTSDGCQTDAQRLASLHKKFIRRANVLLEAILYFPLNGEHYA